MINAGDLQDQAAARSSVGHDGITIDGMMGSLFVGPHFDLESI
jgi:hypothetical protein